MSIKVMCLQDDRHDPVDGEPTYLQPGFEYELPNGPELTRLLNGGRVLLMNPVAVLTNLATGEIVNAEPDSIPGVEVQGCPELPLLESDNLGMGEATLGPQGEPQGQPEATEAVSVSKSAPDPESASEPVPQAVISKSRRKAGEK